jgi:hypothetical protein
VIGAFPVTWPGAGQKRRVVLLTPAPGFFYQFNGANNGEKTCDQIMQPSGLMSLNQTTRPEQWTRYSLTRRMPMSDCHRYPTCRNQNAVANEVGAVADADTEATLPRFMGMQ